MIKSYLVFTSCLYRLVMFLLLPAACVGACLLGCCYGGGRAGGGILVLTVLLLPAAEILLDIWVFPGIQRSDPTRLECLKTSGRGRDVMRRALIADMVRKLIFSAAVPALGYAAIVLWELLSGVGEGGLPAGDVRGAFGLLNMVGGAGAALWCLSMIAFFYSVLGTFLSRFGNMIWINMIVGYHVAGGLEIASLFLPGLFIYPYAYGAAFGLLGLGIGWLAVRTAMGRMERGYYDQKPSRRDGTLTRRKQYNE